jgi:hypothetical protein
MENLSSEKDATVSCVARALKCSVQQQRGARSAIEPGVMVRSATETSCSYPLVAEAHLVTRMTVLSDLSVVLP